MTATNQNFSMYSGNSKKIIITVTSPDGTALNGSISAKWFLKEHDVSEGIIIQKTLGSGMALVNGKLEVTLTQADTDNLDGTYHQECELTDQFGNISTILVGTVTIK